MYLGTCSENLVKRLDALSNSFLECCLGKETHIPNFKGKLGTR